MKILGAIRWSIEDAEFDSSRRGQPFMIGTCRRHSMGGGEDGASHDCYATFNRWNDGRNVNVNRNNNDWNDNWSFAGVPKLASFLTPLWRG